MNQKKTPSAAESGPAAAWSKASWYAFLTLFAGTTLAVAKLPFVADTNPVTERFAGAEFAALTTLTAIAALTWLVAWFLGDRSIRYSPTLIAAGVFAVAAVVSTLFADVLPLAVMGEPGRYTGLVTWLCCMIVLFLSAQLVDAPSKLRSITDVTIVLGVIEAGLGVLQRLQFDPLRLVFPEGQAWMLNQGVGTIGNPNHYATILIVPFVLAISDVLFLARGPRRWFGLGATVLIGTALVVAATRGAWIGAVAGLLVLLLFAWRSRRADGKAYGMVAGAVVLSLALGFLLIEMPQLTNRMNVSDSTAPVIEQISNGRIEIWRQTLAVIMRDPVVGVGPDSVYNAFKAAGKSAGVLGIFTDDPHNLLLLITLSFGVVGLAVTLALLYTSLREPVVRAFKGSSGASEETLAPMNGWLAGLFGLMVTSFVSVMSVPTLLTLAVALGVIHGPYLARSRKTVTARPWVVAATGVLLVGFAAVSLYAAWLPIHHNARIRSVELTTPLPDEAYTALDDADRALPWRYDILTARVAWLIQQSAYEHIQGDDSATTGNGRFVLLSEQMRERTERFPADYFVWLSRVKVKLAHAEAMRDAQIKAEGLELLEEAQQRFPNDPELLELATLAQQI